MTLHFNRSTETEKRRELRRASTDAENALWRHLRHNQMGIRFRRQFSVDAFVLDFYAPHCKLAIEVDGDSHFTQTGVGYDRERTQHLAQFGIRVLRFTNLEVLQELDSVLTAIEDEIQARTSP